MSRPTAPLFPSQPLMRVVMLRSLLWTLVVGLFLGLGNYYSDRETAEIALNRAKESYRKDVAYRLWVTQRGGVYVPLDEKTPANPYLKDIPNREITTTTGKVYTLVNPAYMTRMVHELGAKEYGLRGHITSLNPIRPENAPDPWERKALERFETGTREYWERQEMEGRTHLRYMGAFLTEQGCLRCHASQGYQVGQVRGGISVAVPMHNGSPIGGRHNWVAMVSLVTLWVIGLLTIVFVARQNWRHLQDRNKALAEVQSLAQQHQAMLQTTRDGFWVTDKDGRLKDVNEVYVQMSGYSREELLTLSVRDLDAQLTAHELAEHAQLAKAAGWDRFETVHRTKKGNLIDVEISDSYHAVESEFVVFIRDITAHKLASRALLDSELRFRMLLEGVDVVGVMLDTQGRVIFANPFLLALTGWTREEVIGQDWFDRFVPGNREDVRRVFQSVISAATTIPRYENPILTRTGETREIAWNNTTLLDEAGKVVGSASLGEDITARKAAEEAVRKSEALLRTFFDAAPDGIFVVDGQGNYLQVNRAAEEMTGYSAEELLKLTIQDLGSADPERNQKSFETLQREGSLHLESVLKRKDGTYFPVFLRAAKIHENLLIGLCRDITEQKRLEEEHHKFELEIQHAQQLESLGSLAGGVAHDMNNVLAAIIGLGSVLQIKLAQDPALLHAVETILHAAGRGRDLVKGLTDFARKGLQESQLLDLNELVQKEAALLHRTTLQRVEVVLDLEPNLPPILGEPNALASTLMNLCINALDAMPKGGHLRLATHHRNGRVELIVEDTGEGMSPEVQKRALEPFFTTKPVGKGTGLGLSMAYGILKAHGGSIDIQSELGRGTRVRMSFPAVSAERAEGAAPETSAIHASKALRVLLVDDDELIRASVPAMLETLGHRAEAASGGLEALRRLEGGLEVDLLILDMNMPGMSGVETLGRVRLIRPNLPILVATGFKEAGLEEILAQYQGVSTLPKPYGMADLAAKLRG